MIFAVLIGGHVVHNIVPTVFIVHFNGEGTGFLSGPGVDIALAAFGNRCAVIADLQRGGILHSANRIGNSQSAGCVCLAIVGQYDAIGRCEHTALRKQNLNSFLAQSVVLAVTNHHYALAHCAQAQTAQTAGVIYGCTGRNGQIVLTDFQPDGVVRCTLYLNIRGQLVFFYGKDAGNHGQDHGKSDYQRQNSFHFLVSSLVVNKGIACNA